MATDTAVRKDRLKLPKTNEEWMEVDEALEQHVVPRVLAETSLDAKNEVLCEGIYSIFADRLGTKPFRSNPTPSQLHYKPHNRELKRLRREKLRA